MQKSTNFRKNLLIASTGKYAGVMISFGSLMILARLVEPRLHGYIGYCAVFITFYELLVDSFYGVAFIVHKHIKKEDLVKDYISNYRVSLIILILGLISCSILIRDLNEKLTVLCAFPVIFFARGQLKIEQLVARRDLKFKALTYGEILAGLGSLPIAALVAYYHPLIGILSYQFALPMINLAYLNSVQGNSLLTNMRSVSWKNDLKERTRISDADFLKDGYLQLYTGISIFAFRNLDNFIVGSFFGAKTLGLYDKSYKTIMMPIRLIPGVLNAVLLPSVTGCDRDLLAKSYARLTKALAPIGVILSFCIYSYSADIVNVLLGGDWQEAILYVKLFAVSMPLQMVNVITAPFFQALSKINLLFRLSLGNAIVLISTLVLSALFSYNVVVVILSIQVTFILMPLIYFFVLRRYVFESSQFLRYHDIILCLLMCLLLLINYWGKFEVSLVLRIVLTYSIIKTITNKDLRKFI